MVQKFVKELNDSAKQSDRSGSAETTATEQVETTAREIVHEAVQLPHRAIQHPARKESADSSADAQPEQSTQLHHAPESPRERTDAPRTRSDATPPQSTLTPAPQEQARRATGNADVDKLLSRGGAANHAGAVTIAALHSDRAIGRKCTAHSARTAAAAERTSAHAAGAGATRIRAAGKEIPRREAVCAG